MDAAELAHLLSLVTRDRVKVGLMREQEQIKTEIQAEEGLLNCTASVTAIRNPRRNDDERANRPRIHTSKITTYGIGYTVHHKGGGNMLQTGMRNMNNFFRTREEAPEWQSIAGQLSRVHTGNWIARWF